MIMLMPLHDNNISSSLDASSTFQPIGLATIPHDGSRIFFLHICFVIFETVSILNNLSTVTAEIIVTSAYTRNEGLIDQDFVFFQNYVIYAPIIVCNISRKLLLIIRTMIMLIFGFDNLIADDPYDCPTPVYTTGFFTTSPPRFPILFPLLREDKSILINNQSGIPFAPDHRIRSQFCSTVEIWKQ